MLTEGDEGLAHTPAFPGPWEGAWHRGRVSLRDSYKSVCLLECSQEMERQQSGTGVGVCFGPEGLTRAFNLVGTPSAGAPLVGGSVDVSVKTRDGR